MGFSRRERRIVARVDQRVTAGRDFFHIETGERGGDHAMVWVRVPSWRPVCPHLGRGTSQLVPIPRIADPHQHLPRFRVRSISTPGMQHPDPTPPSCESPLPERLLGAAGRLCPNCLPARPGQNILLLVAGAILAPGKRTVTAALRILWAGARDRLPDLPWRAQPGRVVVPRRGRLAAAPAACRSALSSAPTPPW